MESTPRIDSVRPVGHLKLLVRFQNCEQRIYDCEPLLTLPQFHLLATEAFFRAVHVDKGGCGIIWNDWIDLSEYELYSNGTPVNDNSAHDNTHAPRQ